MTKDEKFALTVVARALDDLDRVADHLRLQTGISPEALGEALMAIAERGDVPALPRWARRALWAAVRRVARALARARLLEFFEIAGRRIANRAGQERRRGSFPDPVPAWVIAILAALVAGGTAVVAVATAELVVELGVLPRVVRAERSPGRLWMAYEAEVAAEVAGDDPSPPLPIPAPEPAPTDAQGGNGAPAGMPSASPPETPAWLQAVLASTTKSPDENQENDSDESILPGWRP